MINLISPTIIILAYILRTVRQILFQSYLWQLKEYRTDRMASFLRSPAGKKVLFHPISIIKWVLILMVFTIGVYLSNSSTQFPEFSILISFLFTFYYLIWIFEGIISLYKLVLSGWTMPKFTYRIVLILISSIIWQLGLFLFIGLRSFFILGPFLDRLLPLFIFISVYFSAIPVYFIKNIYILKAKLKILKYKNLVVIGITGSYGKTTTKEILAQVLSKKFSVLKTPDYNNTEFAVAQVINRELSNKHRIFIVEMGAYQKGEIKAICDLVHPQIGIITGLNNQHLELFGSIQNIMKTKFELVESLPLHGKLVINIGNKYLSEMISWCRPLQRRVKIHAYLAQQTKIEKIFKMKNIITDLITAENIRENKNSLSFSLRAGEGKDVIHSNIIGALNVENILAVLSVSRCLGVPMSEVKKALTTLQALPHTMRLIKYNSRVNFLDNSFNSNLDGTLKSLDYLRQYRGQRVIIFTPLIELGSESEISHQLLAKKMFEICDILVLTNSSYYQIFSDEKNRYKIGTKYLYVLNDKFDMNLATNLKKDSIILCQGKESAKLLKMFDNYNV